MTELAGWAPGIERAIQRVIAGMGAFYALVMALWISTEATTAGRGTWMLMVAGLAILLVVTVRAWRTRIGTADIVAMNLALLVMLRVNAEVGTDGIGIQAGPAYVFMTTSLLLAALTLPWTIFWRWAALTTAVYVLGRYVGGTIDDLWSGLDEAISDTSTIAAAGLVLTRYRRAGRRADEATAARLEAGRREALADAVEQAAAEERRILHDQIIAALVSIEHAGSAGETDRASEAASRAREGLADGRADIGSTPESRWLVDTTGLRVPVTIDIDPELMTSGVVRPAVTVALVGAINEALRNVERHSGSQSVSVDVRRAGDAGVRVIVQDDGRGLPPDHVAGFGIRQSIEARMHEVGGAAEVRNGPDGGAVVELVWPADRPAGTTVPAAHVLSAIGDPRRFTYAVTGVALGGQLWLVARHLHGVHEAAVAVSTTALVLAVAWLAPRRPIGRGVTVAVVALAAALLAWGLAAAGDGALLDFRSWTVELTCVLIFTLVFFISFRALMALAVTLAVVMVVWCAQDPAVAVADATDPILQPIFYAAAIGATVWGLRALGVTTAQEERRSVQQMSLEAAHVAQTIVDRERFHHLRATLDPFFEAVQHQSVDVSEPEVIDRARALAIQVRDEMYLPGLLDDDLRLLLATARESGTSITIRATASPEGGAAVRRLLKAAIDPMTVRTATLSLPDSGAPYVRLVILPAADEPTRDRLGEALDPIGAEIESLEHATVITVPITPAGAPRPAPS